MVAFRITPLFYQAWWFYLVCAMGAASVLGAGVRWRVREVRRIGELKRLKDLNEQRHRIASDMHDDLGSTLTQIAHLGELAQGTAGQPEQARARAQRIASLAQDAVNHISEIVWAENPKYDTLEDLVAYLREYAAEFLAPTQMRPELDFPEAIPAVRVTGLFRRHLLLLLKEALQNTVRHADAARVRIRVEVQNNRLHLSVADDGKGLSARSGNRQGNGLPNMRQRVIDLGGSFELKSEPGQGTAILAIIPLP